MFAAQPDISAGPEIGPIATAMALTALACAIDTLIFATSASRPPFRPMSGQLVSEPKAADSRRYPGLPVRFAVSPASRGALSHHRQLACAQGTALEHHFR